MDTEIDKTTEYLERSVKNDILDECNLLKEIDTGEYEEYILLSFLLFKKKRTSLDAEETMILEELYKKYILATGDSLTFNDFKGLSSKYSFSYPETKLNQINISHTLEENKTPLLKIAKSFISAWDMISYFQKSILKNNSLLKHQNKEYSLPSEIRKYIILTHHLDISERLYADIFEYYTNYLSSTKFGKYKYYLMLSDEITNKENLIIIKRLINLANDLNYKNLKKYRPMEYGEVASSPEEVEARENFLNEDDSGEDLNEEDNATQDDKIQEEPSEVQEITEE